jgi:hypothetical protein
MRRYPCTWLGGLAGAIAFLSLLMNPRAAEPAADAYTPVAPPPAVHAAVRDNLKTVEDWIDRKDFASAAESSHSIAALAHLCTYQGSEPAWKDKTASLLDASSRLATAIRGKDAAACAKQIQQCNRLLDELAKTTPGDRIADKKFKLQGSNKTWMLLMDDAVTEGLKAKKAEDLELLAGALAEEANAMQFMRTDARWRQWFQEIRTAALEASDKAKAKDLDAARVTLKSAYQRCQACHDTSRR